MSDPFQWIHDNKIQFEEAKKRIICYQCKKKIFKRDIIARNIQDSSYEKLNYHLLCFQPVFETPILENQLSLYLGEDSSLRKVKNWVQQWNWSLKSKSGNNRKQNLSIPSLIFSRSKEQNLFSLLGKYQTFLILLFLTTDEILYVIKLVNSRFYEITWSSRLWKQLCYRNFSPLITKSFAESTKETVWMRIFFKIEKTVCFICKTKDSLDIKCCPIEKKPLCKKCRQKDDFILMAITEIKQKYGDTLWHIFDNFIPKFAINFSNEKVFYKRDVEMAFHAYKNFQTKENSI